MNQNELRAEKNSTARCSDGRLCFRSWQGYTHFGVWCWRMPSGLQSGIGPEQPIPFSHRIHATEKRISCVFCHSEAINTDVAGIPPLETCMLCHSKIIIHYPHIADLRNHYYNKIPVEWERDKRPAGICLLQPSDAHTIRRRLRQMSRQRRPNGPRS